MKLFLQKQEIRNARLPHYCSVHQESIWKVWRNNWMPKPESEFPYQEETCTDGLQFDTSYRPQEKASWLLVGISLHWKRCLSWSLNLFVISVYAWHRIANIPHFTYQANFYSYNSHLWIKQNPKCFHKCFHNTDSVNLLFDLHHVLTKQWLLPQLSITTQLISTPFIFVRCS